MVTVNYGAVIGATIVSIVLGFIWYGPLFGKKWLQLSGLPSDAMKMKGGTMILMIIGSFLTAFVLAQAVIFTNAYLNASGISSGIMVGFLNWLGFVGPITLGSVLWEGKSWKLWWVNNAYYIVSFCLMGAILATWQ